MRFFLEKKLRKSVCFGFFTLKSDDLNSTIRVMQRCFLFYIDEIFIYVDH